MHLSREIAGGNGEILELRIGGENVTAHRQMKTHREKTLISAGDDKTHTHTHTHTHTLRKKKKHPKPT